MPTGYRESGVGYRDPIPYRGSTTPSLVFIGTTPSSGSIEIVIPIHSLEFIGTTASAGSILFGIRRALEFIGTTASSGSIVIRVQTEPPPPTDLEIEAGDLGPTVVLSWMHPGDRLHRFEILFKGDVDAFWRSLLMVWPIDIAVGDGEYEITLAASSGEWAVRALNARGEVST